MSSTNFVIEGFRWDPMKPSAVLYGHTEDNTQRFEYRFVLNSADLTLRAAADLPFRPQGT